MSVTTKLEYTPLAEIPTIHAALKAGFNSGKTRDIAFRKKQLLGLAYMVKDNIPRFEAALAHDLGRPQLESHLMEISLCVKDAIDAYHNVDKWAKTEKAPFTLNFVALKPTIRKEPKGVVLIISPFNYPAWLCLGPLAGAIAAGNAVVIKPSENTHATSSLLAELVPKYLDRSVFRVVNGGIPETTSLLELQWDHILYTGNGTVGKIVATAAAKHLTPTTLELGGKCPVFIDPKYDLHLAARRIAWGKFANSGQTCVAPDYILVPVEAQDKFIAAFADVYKEFYPDGAAKSDSYSRIISEGHWNRINGLLTKTKGQVVLGGDTDGSQKFIAPTVVKNVKADDSLMSQEIFGPVLPIVPVASLDDAIAYVRGNDHPLALYVFTNDADFKKKVFESTQSGAAVANEVLMHTAVDGLPFGGTGPSGYGYHTGKYSFDTFTHLRSSLDTPGWFDVLLRNRYPPYTSKKLNTLNRILYPSIPSRDGKESHWGRWIISGLVISLFAAYGLKNPTTIQNTLTYLQNIVLRQN
ncbi:NAD-aldehyde dehydrogenase [Rickenella mellea]|uniref:Aldehyde dehydrogenase n=1 Tax=Rickenella mellea TaxID=50990 RepID=A0A4R5XE11_9AGAM|nr:NAD-aldehyde dehydrogenase [Rickenella mellea]